ncbi:hypothetical protein [Bradyrhizobium sp. ISRA463]|uniref:hypothetical protein n=1 Tax=Bradyrhizobium sp. ISRA463 TaxID=2866199 RepID=UPI0032B05FDA
MAEEAFALSPISARAAQPSEEDYAAISEAFMETSRGRWFLGEYAKRNRNADTRMVLDAVARIEESLAAQREAAADAFRDEQLEQALAALRGAVEAVQASAIAALDELSFEQRLAPIRKGVRVIREISWRLREIGNDGRICDIMDSQASAIEAGASQVSLDEAKTVVDAAFAALTRRLAEFNAEEAAAPATEPAVAEAAVAEAPAAPRRQLAQLKAPSPKSWPRKQRQFTTSPRRRALTSRRLPWRNRPSTHLQKPRPHWPKPKPPSSPTRPPPTRVTTRCSTSLQWKWARPIRSTTTRRCLSRRCTPLKRWRQSPTSLRRHASRSLCRRPSQCQSSHGPPSR